MSELQQKLVKMVEQMPAFSKSVHQVLHLTADLNYSHKELVRIIDYDPVMTLKILKLVNSAYFGFARKVASINQAVVFLGMNTIKNLALSVATRGILPQLDRGGLHTGHFLTHSVGVATVAKMLARRLGATDREATDYFVAGLLHDFGKVVFSQFMPLEFQEAQRLAKERHCSLRIVERDLIGADHADIGSLLGEKWQLPPDLVLAIRHHHGDKDGQHDSPMLDCVNAANQITKLRGFGDSGSPIVEPLTPSAQARFGTDLEGLVASLGDLDREMKKAQVIIKL
ncbi:MAG: HDOD domain-containing protein [Magnetococcales bacterium]|nr:HDOD domain-containing protein [Magnetococcales bacterium]